MRYLGSVLSAIVALGFALPASANARTALDSVPAEYTPIDNTVLREPVSMSSYRFEINEETGRARVVVEYTYPDQLIYGPNDDTRGPRSSFVQIPGLTYDAAAGAIVYTSNGARNVCATVEIHGGVFGRHIKVRNTGACTVRAVAGDHSEDDGWSIHHYCSLDTYLEVR